MTEGIAIATLLLHAAASVTLADMLITGVLTTVTQIGEATHLQHNATPAPLANSGEDYSWFAVQTKARHEKRVAAQLEEKGVEAFLPLLSEVHRWSDRKRQVEVPLFTTYVFVRIGDDKRARVNVLQTNGVFGFVGIRGVGVPIPDQQIETVQLILRERVVVSPHPFLSIGQKVRIRGGSLDGISGVLSAINGDRSLIVSVDSIQRSLALRIDGYGVEPV